MVHFFLVFGQFSVGMLPAAAFIESHAFQIFRRDRFVAVRDFRRKSSIKSPVPCSRLLFEPVR